MNFIYQSFYLGNHVQFFYIKPEDRQQVVSKIGDRSIQAVIIPDEKLNLKRQFYMGKHSREDSSNLFNFIKFITIPVVDRTNLDNFCSDIENQFQDSDQ